MSGLRRNAGRAGIAIVVLAACARASGQQSDAVRISVAEDRLYGRAAYRYRVENDSQQRTIVAFRIGADHRGARAELRQPPYGWTDEKGLPLGSAVAPDGWAVEAVRDERERWFVEWFSSESDEAFDIAPGEMRDGFSVIVFDAAPEYLAGHWTVVFSDGQRLSGVLRPDRP